MDDGITRNHCLNLEALQKNQMPESWIMKLQLLNKQWLSCVWGLNCVGLPGLSFCLLFFFVLFFCLFFELQIDDSNLALGCF